MGETWWSGSLGDPRCGLTLVVGVVAFLDRLLPGDEVQHDAERRLGHEIGEAIADLAHHLGRGIGEAQVRGQEGQRVHHPGDHDGGAEDTEELANLLEIHPFIQRAVIEKEYPDKLVVSLKERTPVLWLAEGELQLLAGDGTILPRRLLETGGFDLPVYIPDGELERLAELERHSDESLLSACALCAEMQCLALPLADELIEIEPADNALRGLTAGGGVILLPLEADAALLAALQAVWSRERLTGYSALDARYEGQIVARGGVEAPPPPPSPSAGEELLVVSDDTAEL